MAEKLGENPGGDTEEIVDGAPETPETEQPEISPDDIEVTDELINDVVTATNEEGLAAIGEKTAEAYKPGVNKAMTGGGEALATDAIINGVALEGAETEIGRRKAAITAAGENAATSVREGILRNNPGIQAALQAEADKQNEAAKAAAPEAGENTDGEEES